MLAVMLVFYFFFIRPQANKQKQQGVFLDNISKGDEIVLSSGIVGKITRVDDNTIQLQVDQKTFINVLKSAISKEMTDALKAPVEKK